MHHMPLEWSGAQSQAQGSTAKRVCIPVVEDTRPPADGKYA